MEKITTDGLRFVDEYGRERIFTGMNVCDKKDFDAENPAYGYPADTFPFEEYRARGFDMIRLGFTWGAMEPKPGRYNEELIRSLGDFLDKCAEYGIYAYLDCHQDCWGPATYGDGAPAWATLTDQFKPVKPKMVWAEPYFYGRACHRAFDNFWSNRPYNRKGLQDYYADMWRHVAKALAGKPAFFGYDFLNEPFPGADGGKLFRKVVASAAATTVCDKRVSLKTMVKQALGDEKPRALDEINGEVFRKLVSVGDGIVRNFDEKRYSPFLGKMTKAVREESDAGIVFIEDCYFSNLGIPSCAIAVENAEGREPKQCFAPHAYDLMVDTPAYKYASDSRVTAIFDVHRQTQLRLGVPCLIGEWGSRADGDGWYPHFRTLLKQFDGYKWSNTYWCYYDGILQEDFVDKLLTRPHPKAVCGEIVSYAYDEENGVFTLTWKQDKKCKAPTVVYIDRDCKSVECDGKYEIKKWPGDVGSDVEIKTDAGEHTLTIKF